MSWVPLVVALALGFALGLLAAFALRLIHTKTAQGLAQDLIEKAEEKRRASMEQIISELKASFGDLSLDALSKSTEEFLKLAKSRFDAEREVTTKELESKKALIDTTALREALASTKARGQWGERMAEDVLRLAGFVENINYVKQKAIAGLRTRPDFTFLLPKDLRLNMDVKFPLDNYLRYLEAESDMEKQQFRNSFLRDVKARIKEITTRDYINPEQNTLDYVLLFIPNEQIYAFIQEEDPTIAEEALKNKVVICSPITLFAILAVIRQAVDNFALERTSAEILVLLGTFKKQWEAFIKRLENLGRRINEARKEYDAIMTTRRRQLEKPLNRIEELRVDRALPQAQVQDEEDLVDN
ncbi:MAG: DNA recombination protein RmuC [Deltaproteobacteria bacterium]|nr:DNA recombination protein RmuC [Deltaproteobacteria bacterium]